MKNMKIGLMVALFGLSFAGSASEPREMPELFREAAQTPGGVLSFATAVEDEVFATGNRAAAESRKWTILGMIVEIDRFRDKNQLIANVPEWLRPCAKGDCPQCVDRDCPHAKGDCTQKSQARQAREQAVCRARI